MITRTVKVDDITQEDADTMKIHDYRPDTVKVKPKEKGKEKV